MTTITDDDRSNTRSRIEAIGAAGKRWIAAKANELAKLPQGTVVLIDIETGDYVTARTYIAAQDEFDRRFGPDRTAYEHQIGRSIFLGGGLLGTERG